MNYQIKLDHARNQSSLRIEALESALIELKLKTAQQVDQAQMQLAEMESYLLSQHRTDEDIDDTMEEAFMLLAPKKPGSEEAMIVD